jgi:hypothetical protein
MKQDDRPTPSTTITTSDTEPKEVAAPDTTAAAISADFMFLVESAPGGGKGTSGNDPRGRVRGSDRQLVEVDFALPSDLVEFMDDRARKLGVAGKTTIETRSNVIETLIKKEWRSWSKTRN